MLAGGAARANDVPAPLALTVMLKVLTYDDRFDQHGQGDFLVLVPYGPAEEAAAREAVATASGLDQKSILKRGLRFDAVPLSQLRARVVADKAAALLAPRGTSDATAKELAAEAASSKLYTLAFDVKLVESSLLLGVANNQGRPQVVVNSTAAKACNVEFRPAVLKLARTVL